MPEESSLEKDTLQGLLAHAGLQEIKVQDMVEHVVTRLRLF